MSVTLRGGVRPSLLARDMRETLAFYEGLGFQLDGCFPDKESPQWMALHRGEARLMFHSVSPSGHEKPGLSGTLYFEPHSVDLLAAEWNGKVEFCWGPGLMDYGWYEFGIRDPNGYYLAFAQEWELEGEPVDSGG
jgi:catechol 2,3-dioxygenase-like lactoylglutathione lyase family enzyme